MLGGITKIIQKALGGSKSEKDIKKIEPLVADINAIGSSMQSISNDELRAKTAEFKAKIQEAISTEQGRIDDLKKEIAGQPDMNVDEKESRYQEIDEIEKEITEKIEVVLEEILPEAFAVVRETARRFSSNEFIEVTATEMDQDIAASRDSVVIEGGKAKWSSTWMAAGNDTKWEMVHYDVQLIGGTVLHRGNIAEMATGEGKTLVATLPVYINALSGRGVHVVTVNDYLARRDSEWMGPIFEFHGLTIDCIDHHQPNSPERRAAYAADITYGTNNEFGFDYLRDNMATHPNDLVQRGHNFAIVDEVDSVLIDDARTPLIISGPTPRGDQQQFSALKPAVEVLVRNQRELVNRLLADAKKLLTSGEQGTDKKAAEKALTDGGLALFRAYRGLPKNKALIKFLSEDGRRQQLQKTENFYMQENNKLMPEADKELFFVIDEKQNSIELTEKGLELISGGQNDKNFFILPDIGAELAQLEKEEGTLEEKAAKKEQLMQDYSVKAERVHSVNQLLKAYALFERDVEYVLMDNKIKIVDEQTGRIMEGRRYSDGLHQAIEAKENVKIEAATQTYASVTLQNYFRMYNKLSGMTGTAETEAGEFWEIYELDVVVIPTNRPIQRDDREDLVYKTTREKFNAVIEEVVKLSKEGRPVLVGTTSVEVSELLSRMLKMRKIEHNVLNAKLHQREADIVAMAGKSSVVTIATNMAGRGTDIKLSKEVKEAGGLAIIGTERHDSRRVDRQLRGRSGRQGDPGSSQFFVSLEDNLMRLFGSDRIARLMDRMGYEEGEVIQHSMITKSIERAQKKVEENNFGIRKRLLEYDDVMNKQREAIYRKRRNALFGERLAIDVADAIYDVCSGIVGEFLPEGDYEGFEIELVRSMALQSPVSESEFSSLGAEDLTGKVFDAAQAQYERKKQLIAQAAFPVIKQVYENENQQFKNIQVPFTDGRRTMNIQADLEEAFQSQAISLSSSLEKFSILGMIDMEWKEHLREMDDLRQSVQNATYEQKDPLLIYKFESFELFEKMVNKMNKATISFLMKANLPAPDPELVKQAQERKRVADQTQTSKTEVPQFGGGGNPPAQQGGGGAQVAAPPKPKPAPVRVEKKVGRNDPCPCGSGKKYKTCHGRPGN